MKKAFKSLCLVLAALAIFASCTPESTEKKIEEFESAGYDVLGYYMHLPREESAKRGFGI